MIIHTLIVSASLAIGALTPAKNSNISTDSSQLATTQPPKIIYVEQFTLAASAAATTEASEDSDRPHLFGIFRQRREQQKKDALAKVPGVLQKALIENLNASIAPATASAGDHATVGNRWVITGQFTEVDTGNGALQAGIGFGAGQSKLEVTAQVSRADDVDEPFLTFDSKGASGHMPGAIMMHNPYVAAAKFVMSKNQPEKEAKKIAKVIAEEIGKFMAAQGIATVKASGGGSEGPPSSSASSKANR